MKAKTPYKIKTVRGNLVVTTEGMHLFSLLTKKADLEKALQTSKAHKWLLDQAINTQPKKLTQVPSTDTQSFKVKAFYQAVKLVVENLVVIEGMKIDAAVKEGNSLLGGKPVVVDSLIVHSQVKEALRYRGAL